MRNSFIEKNKNLIIPLSFLGLLGGVHLIKYLYKRKREKGNKRICYHDPKFQEKIPLTYKEATARSDVIENVSYEITLALHKGKSYSGQILIELFLKKITPNLFLDFSGKSVISCNFNKTSLDPSKIFIGHRIQIPEENLVLGTNQLLIEFENDYATDGNGFHHFVDPKDQKEYLYTDFEPYKANKAFPLFYQPDMKGSMSLVTMCPKGWVVISNEPKTASFIYKEDKDEFLKMRSISPHFIKEYKSDTLITFFQPTPPISSYLYAVIAGEYVTIHDEGFHTTPIRLLCRASMLEQVNRHAQSVFHYTKCAILFYIEFFGIDFPFRKLDQIIVPEYNMGAMENVGAITYNEGYFKDSELNEYEKTRMAIVILHEISHMWFGDLVTMKWWGDLWLNESFATFMSHLCLANAKGLEDLAENSWPFLLKDYVHSIDEDQYPTTHPVASTIKDTEEAENSFDALTYEKGALIIRQLFYLISHKAFSVGVHKYFNNFSYKNTSLDDFLQCLKTGCESENIQGIDLKEWSEEWIKTAGINTITPTLEIEEGKIKSFIVNQAICQTKKNILRTMRIEILIIDKEGVEEKIPNILIEKSEKTEIKELNGRPEPEIVLLNSGGEGYAKVHMDKKSVSNLEKSPKIYFSKKLVARQLQTISLFNMCKDHKISAPVFLNIIGSLIEFETVETNLVLAFTSSRFAIANFIPFDMKAREYSRIFDTIIKRIPLETSPQVKKILLQEIPNFARTEDKKEFCKNLLQNNISKFDKIEWEKEVRLSILARVYSSEKIALEEKTKLLDKETKDDNSDITVKGKKTCEAALPDPLKQKEYWNMFIAEAHNDSSHNYIAAMKGFSLSLVTEKMEELYLNEFLSNVINVFEKQDTRYAHFFFMFLVPHIFSDDSLKRFQDLEKKLKQNMYTLKKHITEHIYQIQMNIQGIASSNLFYSSTKQ